MGGGGGRGFRTGREEEHVREGRDTKEVPVKVGKRTLKTEGA
jgi:hypothetical protein